MLLSIIIIVLLGLIAFYHYTQGLFAATVSAICAGVAALLAFSYHETLIARFSDGQLGSYGNPLALAVLFAVIYIGLRFLMDLIPGNVRYPVALDRVGAAVMGVVAGIFATAIIALVAQDLPFGPSVAFYTAYETEARQDVRVDRRLSRIYRIPDGSDAINRHELQLTRFDAPEAEEKRQSLWLPVDEWFLGLVGKLSDHGALAGGTNFRAVHPDYKTATFAERLGMQRAASQVAFDPAGQKLVKVTRLFHVQTEGEGAQFPQGLIQVPGDLGVNREVDNFLLPGSGKALLVVRMAFDQQLQDAGRLVRFSPGTARLVIDGRQYYPIASLESGEVAVRHKPDDYLLAGSGVDFIYEVERTEIGENGRLRSPAFLEFKEYTRVDLGNREVDTQVTKSPATHVMRKIPVQEWIAARKGGRAVDARGVRTEFDELRATVPDTEPEPQRPDDPAEGDAEAGEGDTPMDTIRKNREQQEELLKGGGEGGGKGGGGSPD